VKIRLKIGRVSRNKGFIEIVSEITIRKERSNERQDRGV
jgi:hypothetical protein